MCRKYNWGKLMKKFFMNKRYIFDSLYGIIYLRDLLWNVISTPELQRLREIRLCNINSLCLTGGANINRYEHAIGTAYLAQKCLENWPPLNPISTFEEKCFLLAALLHDLKSAAFGHTVQYIESRDGFEHEKAFERPESTENGKNYTYKNATLEPVFFHMIRELPSKIKEDEAKLINDIIAGKGKLGPLINSTIDLDNIDNVFRLAYHIGLINSGETPVALAKSLYIKNNKLTLLESGIPLVEEWYKVRRKLYSFLLLNPEEFSGKCMLTEAIEKAKQKNPKPFNWYHVDYEVLEKLSSISHETNEIISRLMKGDLYGCFGIFSTSNTKEYKIFSDFSKKDETEKELNKIIQKYGSKLRSARTAIHTIIDIDKTERQITIHTDANRTIQIGNSSNRLLIGIFLTNVNMYEVYDIPFSELLKARKEVSDYLARKLKDSNIKEIELYGEAEEKQ
jgi:HD superfamily phosphohydrolase